MSWINHLPPACWSTLWKSNFKQQLGCRFDIMDNITYLYVFWHMQLYMSWYIRSFFGFTSLNILYFFKYSGANIFHRRSLYTFYWNYVIKLVFLIYCFIRYTIWLSSLCKIISRHWTYKMPVRYIWSSVWVRLSIFSPLSIIQSIIQYVGLCVFSLPTPLVMIERIYILCLIIIIKSEVWTIIHCLGLGHETMVCAVCLYIFW